MSLAVPIVVHIGNGHGQRCITGQARDVTFRKTIPGGYASATIDLDQPLGSASNNEFGLFAAVEISDARHGGMLWEGRLEDPGRTVDASGSKFQISAVGPAGSFNDVSRPYVGIDSSAESWTRLSGTPRQLETVSWDIETRSTFGNSGPAILHAIPVGMAMPAGAVLCGSDYFPIVFTQQALGSLRITFIAGVTDPNFDFAVYVGNVQRTSIDASTSQQSVDLREGVNWSGNFQVVSYLWGRAVVDTGSTNDWFRQNTFVVKPRLTTKGGVQYTSTDTFSTYSDEIIEDLVGGSGRIPLIDGPSTSIAGRVNPIRHFVYPDGVTAAKLLEDLMLIETNCYYAAWEKTTTGKHRFEWATWPTDIRYEVSVVDGFNSPGSTADLWSEVTVRYRDAGGFLQVQRHNQYIPTAEFGSVGVTRATILDVGDNNANTASAASIIGSTFLDEHKYPSNGGTINVSQPIIDRTRGRFILPQEIEPGALLAVTDAEPASGNTVLNTERDGRTVFRVTAVDYRASDNTATLSLDVHARTSPQAVSDLAKSQIKRRR